MKTYKLNGLLLLGIAILAIAYYIFTPTNQKNSQQHLISGPMLGHIDLRSANVWFELNNTIDEYELLLVSKDDTNYRQPQKFKKIVKHNAFYSSTPITHTLFNLSPNCTYQYSIIIDGESHIGNFKTQELWAYRKPAPDFSFLTGSCNFVNERQYDRPGKPYGHDSSVFVTMAKEPANFMLWLGDNWYYREVDYGTLSGLYYRASHDRAQAVMQNFLQAMPHYAIWDDHDFGPNDSHKDYILKAETRDVFKQYWANPSYGYADEGIYTTFSYSDVQFFLLDDRFFRDADNLSDKINNAPNPNKRMFGKKQLKWLFNSLAASRATFKIIVTGSQVLNEHSPYDGLFHYPIEHKELLKFLVQEKIKGVLFMSGDRHHSEIIKKNIYGFYPLYDITCSPLTSGSHFFGGREKNNPQRVLGIDNIQNYTKVNVTGDRGNRHLEVTYFDIKGNKLDSWTINQSALKP